MRDTTPRYIRRKVTMLLAERVRFESFFRLMRATVSFPTMDSHERLLPIVAEPTACA